MFHVFLVFKQNQQPEKQNTIGYLPQIPPLYTDMTVAEYLNLWQIYLHSVIRQLSMATTLFFLGLYFNSTNWYRTDYYRKMSDIIDDICNLNYLLML